MAVKDIFLQTKRTVPLVCGLRLRLESATPHHQRRPTQRGRRHRQKDKNRSPSAKNKRLSGIAKHFYVETG